MKQRSIHTSIQVFSKEAHTPRLPDGGRAGSLLVRARQALPQIGDPLAHSTSSSVGRHASGTTIPSPLRGRTGWGPLSDSTSPSAKKQTSPSPSPWRRGILRSSSVGNHSSRVHSFLPLRAFSPPGVRSWLLTLTRHWFRQDKSNFSVRSSLICVRYSTSRRAL